MIGIKYSFIFLILFLTIAYSSSSANNSCKIIRGTTYRVTMTRRYSENPEDDNKVGLIIGDACHVKNSHISDTINFDGLDTSLIDIDQTWFDKPFLAAISIDSSDYSNHVSPASVSLERKENNIIQLIVNVLI